MKKTADTASETAFREQEFRALDLDFFGRLEERFDLLHRGAERGFRVVLSFGDVIQHEVARAGFVQAVVHDAFGCDETLVDVARGAAAAAVGPLHDEIAGVFVGEDGSAVFCTEGKATAQRGG